MKIAMYAAVATILMLANTAISVEIVSPTVGFTRVSLKANTWHLLGISFEQTDETAIGIAEVLGTVGIPNGTRVMVWDTAATTYRLFSIYNGVWSGLATELPPGRGFWIRSTADHTLNLMGQVPQADLAAITLYEGFQLISSPYPASIDALDVQTPADGDRITSFDGTRYLSATYYNGAWSGALDARTLQPNRGYWYKSVTEESRNIEFPRPYNNP